MKYTVAFMFDPSLTQVALIRKAKPEWQAGKLNGIGGKLEDGETFWKANVREFREETGIETYESDWKHFAQIETPQTEIAFFCCKSDQIESVETQPPFDEHILVLDLSGIFERIELGQEKAVENLIWLIALAKDHLQDGRPIFASIVYNTGDTVAGATHDGPAIIR